MPPIYRESRQDQDCSGRMPDVIHLAPTLEVDCPVDSPEEPVIIEDLTGYEVVKGRYYLVIRSSQTEYLIEGERMDIGVLLPQKANPKREDPTRQSHSRKQKQNREAKHREVTQAFSMLRPSSDLSEITLDEKNTQLIEFEQQRISL